MPDEITQLPSEEIYLIPLSDDFITPLMLVPLTFDDPSDIMTIMRALKDGNRKIGFATTEKPCFVRSEIPRNLPAGGTSARIVKVSKNLEGGLNIIVKGLKRFKMEEIKYEEHWAVMKAVVHYPQDKNDLSEIESKVWINYIDSVLEDLIAMDSEFPNAVACSYKKITDLGALTDFLIPLLQLNRQQYQQLIDEYDVVRRAKITLSYLKKRREFIKVKNLIRQRIEIEANEETTDDTFWDNALKETKEALEQFMDPDQDESEDENEDSDGDSDDSGEENTDLSRGKLRIDPSKMKLLDSLSGGGINSDQDNLIEKYENCLKKLNVDQNVRDTIQSQIDHIKFTPPTSAEFSTYVSYLDTVFALPFDNTKPSDYNLSTAKQIIEDSHYGMRDIKDRIIEFLAVRKLKNDNKGTIICLIGPPGVGKTSIGISIAKALNKKYYRFSVGGMHDEAEIRGHRKTYVAAMPGKIIQGLKATGVNDPVFLIDEVDKLASSNQGDPAAALLEVLDPEQNKTFRDNYLDFPFDLSSVVFILTANNIDDIPSALVDRMEVIELSGYTSQEKLEIGKRYLVPKSIEKNGLKPSQISFPDKSLSMIAEEYAREAGVRNFEKGLDKISRKTALKLLESPQTKTPVSITPSTVKKYLGTPLFRGDEIVVADRAGTAIGLAWTSMGGEVLEIEVKSTPGKGELKLTGHLGDVMKESAEIACTWVKSYFAGNKVISDFLENNNVHIHIPEGATPKDGPSAGITLATALCSLVKNTPIRKNLAMTGELTLTGKVMPIGGLKEKVLAAKRNKITDIILPKRNLPDLDKLDSPLRKGITFHPVSGMEEVIDIAFSEN